MISQSSGSPPWWNSVYWHVRRWGPILLQTAGVIWFGVLGLVADKPGHLQVVFAIVVTLAGAVWGQFEARRVETAYNAMEVAELRRDSLYGSVQTAVQGILDQMVTSCAACDESCRVSLYCFDTEANEFVMLGRSSKDAKHREIGRGRYPAGIGYIGYAWEEGPRAAYRRWPRDPEDWVRKAAGESDVRVNDTAVLPVQVAQHIAFKARSAVYERVDYNGTRIGMLVVESLKPDEATNAKVGPLLESDLGRVLGQIVFLAQDEFVSAHRRTASGLEASD